MRVGNYTLSELLGRGGTSEVYAAQHAFLGDAVAVKLLRTGPGDDAQAREAFVAEATRTREIAHPNVVRVLDVGHDAATGACYLVMERIDGETLAARLRRVRRLDEPTLRRLAAAIADGMQAAHARGIVHRDLKPGNVMLRSSGSASRSSNGDARSSGGDVPTIVDFGIAKSLGAASAVHTERRIGTVAYMAPEQLTDGLITPAADIWALGVILFEAATGQLPFGNFADGRLPQLFDTPPRASMLASTPASTPASTDASTPTSVLAPISAALDDLIARCLERDPGKRPATMADVARALRGEADERITADAGALEPVAPLAVRAPRRRLWPIAAASVACAGVVAAGLLIARDDAPGTRPGERTREAVTRPAAPPPDAGVETTRSVDARAGVEATRSTDAAATSPERTRERARAKRTREKPRKRTTSQGETLD